MSTTSANIEKLIVNGYLKRMNGNEKKLLLSFILFLSKFWISEAAISYSKLKSSEQIEHYIKLLMNILSDYCTTKGRKQIEAQMAE